MTRGRKGTVGIGTDRGWLRLQWRVDGKRYFLSLGLEDNPINRTLAQQRALLVQRDIQYGEFDPTLKKYKSEKAPQKGASPAKILESYMEFKAQNVDSRSMEKYQGLLKRVQKRFTFIPVIDVEQAFKFRDELLNELAPITVRERIMILRSAWSWWLETHGDQHGNPWEKVKVKVPPKAKPKPFTADEMKRIIEGFRSDQYYSYLADVVEFSFSLGCRPGEAFGLKWKHLNDDCSVIWIGESWSRGQRKPTKTNKERAFTP